MARSTPSCRCAGATIFWPRPRSPTRGSPRASRPGPLFGLPIAVKDLALTKGLRTTFGSRIFADFVPDEDSYVVERLRNAGAIIIGKTNVPEFGLGSQTYNEVFGATRNAFDRRLTSGGSSGGAAVAVALAHAAVRRRQRHVRLAAQSGRLEQYFRLPHLAGQGADRAGQRAVPVADGRQGADGAQCRRPRAAARRPGRLRSARAALAGRRVRVVAESRSPAGT